MNSPIAFSTVDVFTKERFRGNPVAVVHDATGLKPDQMQAVAREFGYSETAFIFPPRDNDSIAQVRIFTPNAEVPFAGHPNIGTAFVIAHANTASSWNLSDTAVLDELGGPVHVQLIHEAGTVVGAQIQAPQGLQKVGDVDPVLVARCLGLHPKAIASDKFAPCVASVGLPFAFVELSSLDDLTDIQLDASAFRQAAETGPETVDGFSICAFVVLAEVGETIKIRSRVFSPLGHPTEDPATGSASGALAALLLHGQRRSAGKYDIVQGVEMGRQSEIHVSIVKGDDRPRIRGHCVMVSRGTIHV